MKKFFIKQVVIGFLALFTSSAAIANQCDHPSITKKQGFLLPIEVLGKEGVVESRTFQLTQKQVKTADKIFFYANNLSYQNKGSLKVNDSSWVKLNHDDIDIYSKEMAYGGMQHGGMNSIRFTVSASDLEEGQNTIQFRFDVSDGISIGYRLFRFNLLDDDGKPILPDNYFVHDEPCGWKAPEGYEGKKMAFEGKKLWYMASLWNHYLPGKRMSNWYGNKLLPRGKMRAVCSDCHTQDGRDLKYFGYSNKAIIERSLFHGLSEDQSKKIAAYIRSINVPTHGRPWNPPYQPGPSVGEKPIEYWAAGAGIDAVLETDADMLPIMFPNGTTQEEIDKYFDSDKMYDTTTIPIAVQFPDWKHWLPMIHPMDAHGNYYAIQEKNGMLKPGHAYPKHNPFINYLLMRNFLEKHDHDAIIANKDKFYEKMGNFWSAFRKFYTKKRGKGGGWRYSDAIPDKYLPNKSPGFGQFARTSTARLMAVKFFEFHQEFKLEEMTQRLIPEVDQPAPRQWVHAMGYNVFEIPPHFTAGAHGSTAAYEGQPWKTGVMETSTWYELQLVINPGNGRPGGVGPVDFNYHPGFIRKSSKDLPHPMRYYRAMNNVYQVKSFSRDEQDPENKELGFRLLQQGPWNIMPYNSKSFKDFSFSKTLNEVEEGLEVKIMNAMVSQLADALYRPENLPDTYKREKKGNSQFKLDSKGKSDYSPPKDKGYADRLYFYIMNFGKLGVEPKRLNKLIDWCEEAWPKMPWDDIRPA